MNQSKKYVWSLVGLFVLLAAGRIDRCNAVEQAGKELSTTFGGLKSEPAQFEGIELSVEAARQRYAINEPISIRVTLKNLTSDYRTWEQPANGKYFRISAFNSRKEAMTLTAKGLDTLKGQISVTEYSLAPFGEVTYELPANQLVNIARPDSYELVFETDIPPINQPRTKEEREARLLELRKARKLNDNVLIRSNPITITISDEVSKTESAVPAAKNTYQSLGHIGIKFDCYFTIEKEVSTDTFRFYRPIELSSKVRGLKSLAQNLGSNINDFAFVPDGKGLPIIHIIDKKLLQKKDYALDKAISLTYNGPLASLPDSITPLNKQVSSPTDFRGAIISVDYRTIVRIDAKNQSIRSILSDYVPFSRYMRINRVIYQSEMTNSYISPLNSVDFRGPANLTDAGQYAWARAQYPDPQLIPFDNGEAAYALNADNSQSQDAALKYIADHAKAKAATQVRWAMFYLGRYKVERAIPSLIQFLDYQYAPVPVIEERYPALLALSDMGKPASQAALAAMEREDNPIRLELLCRVVLKTLGVDAGEKAIKTLADKTTNQHLGQLSNALESGAAFAQ